MKIVEAKVLVSHQAHDFNKKIADAIKDGWQPYGEVRYSSHGGYFQMYVKYGE